MVRNLRFVYEKKFAFVALFNAKKLCLDRFLDHEINAFEVIKFSVTRTV